MERTTPSEIEPLPARIAELERRVCALKAANRDLRERLDEAGRRVARKATPFRRRDSRKVADGEKKRQRASLEARLDRLLATPRTGPWGVARPPEMPDARPRIGRRLGR